MEVRGRLRVDEVVADGRGHVVVRVLDVSRADASSRVLAELDLGDHDLVAGHPLDLPFVLEVGELDPRDRHAVAGHVDTTGSGDVSRGDYLTTEHVAVPVPPSDLRGAVPGSHVDVEVPLRPVG